MTVVGHRAEGCMAMQVHEQTLRASGSTPFYSCIQPIRGSAGGDLFPHYTWNTYWELL